MDVAKLSTILPAVADVNQLYRRIINDTTWKIFSRLETKVGKPRGPFFTFGTAPIHQSFSGAFACARGSVDQF